MARQAHVFGHTSVQLAEEAENLVRLAHPVETGATKTTFSTGNNLFDS